MSKPGEGSTKVKEPEKLYEVYCVMEARWQETGTQLSEDDEDEDGEPKTPPPPPWQWYYRIRWYGYSSDDDTWEPEHEINKQCSSLVRRFWKHLDVKPGKANRHAEHLAKGSWIAQEMRAFEDLKGVDHMSTSEESEYNSSSGVSKGTSPKSKRTTRSAKALRKRDAGFQTKSKKIFTKMDEAVGPSPEASSSQPKANSTQDLLKRRRPPRIESDPDSEDDVPLARRTATQNKPSSSTTASGPPSLGISGPALSEPSGSGQPLVGALASSPATFTPATVEKAQVQPLPTPSIPPVSSTNAKKNVVPAALPTKAPESNAPPVPGVNRHRGNKLKMLAVPPKPLPPEAPASNRWITKRFTKTNPSQTAVKPQPQKDTNPHPEPKVPEPPPNNLSRPASSTWKRQDVQPGKLLTDDDAPPEPPSSSLFDEADHMDLDAFILPRSNPMESAEPNENGRQVPNAPSTQQSGGQIKLRNSEKVFSIPFLLGTGSGGPERHGTPADALENLELDFERLLPATIISNLLSYLGHPRKFCAYPVKEATAVDSGRLSKLASFLSGTDQVGIGSRQVLLDYTSILLPSKNDFFDQLGQWFPGLLPCNTPLMIIAFSLQSSFSRLEVNALTTQQRLLNSGGPPAEIDDPTFPLVTTLLGIADEHKTWLRGTRFGMYPDETPERMSFDAWALNRFLEGPLKCQRVPLTDSKAKHVIIHSKGRNSLGLIHKLRERRREGPQVAFWRYGWDIDTSLSEAKLRSVYRTGGIITFTPGAIIRTPEKVEDIIRQALLDEHWDYYISPATIALIQHMRLSKINHEAQNEVDSAMLTLLKTHKHGRHLFIGSAPAWAAEDGLALALERYRLSNLPTLEFLREADDILKRDYSQVIKQAKEPVDPHHPKLLSQTQIGLLEKAIEKGIITDMTAMQIQPDLDGFRRFVVVTASASTAQVGNAVEQVSAKDFKFEFPTTPR